MSWSRISEVFFVGNGSRQLGYETLSRISQYSLSSFCRLSCRSWRNLSQSSQVAVFIYDTEEIPYLESDIVHISYTPHISSWVYSKQQSQSTSIPFPLNSFLAISISPINSLYASGTSLNVNTPKPNLNNRYAPKETRAQNGNYRSVELAERLIGIMRLDTR